LLAGKSKHDPDALPHVSRRRFIELAVAAMAARGHAVVHARQSQNGMPYRPLGDTGEEVSIIGLGGHHIGIQGDAEESIRIIRTAIDNGINFMDNSWDYNDGQSELRMGRALQNGYRERVFLMTKIDGRTKAAADRQIDESLRRLQTDRIDLLQFHEIIRTTDAERVFAEGGALEAAVNAKNAGKVRFIGFTGHKNPQLHLNMLEAANRHGFRFDTVQMPLNVMDAHYSSFEKQVLPVLLKQNIAVLAMKSIGNRYILDSKTVSATECLRYAMNLPVATVITGCDSLPILDQALNAARTFESLTEQDVEALLARTANAARNGEFEHYKTTPEFDATEHNPEWLG
jgi:uncharacterized protein